MRDIAEEGAAQRALNAALRKWPRANDAWEALTWILARDPEAGEAVTESGRTRTYTFEGARSLGMPTITVLYETTETKIVVHDALFRDADSLHAGRA